MISELLNLALDAIVFSVLAKVYSEKKKNLEKLRNAPVFNVDPNLSKALGDTEGSAIPYAIVRGSVKATGTSLSSQNVNGLSGVIQVVSSKEHRAWWLPRWWTCSDMSEAIQRTTNIVPFYLTDDRPCTTTVDVRDVECVENLPLTVIFDRYLSPDHTSFIGTLIGWIYPRGVHKVEQMLVEGTRLTGIGRLEVGQKGYVLRAPEDGNDYFLTRLTPEELFQKIEREAQTLKSYATLFACLGFMMAAWGIITWQVKRKKDGEKKALLRRFSEARKRRDKAEEDAKRRGESVTNLTPKCVICMSQPVELLVLECGHACMCLDCGESIGESCPMCRAPIVRTVPAFLP